MSSHARPRTAAAIASPSDTQAVHLLDMYPYVVVQFFFYDVLQSTTSHKFTCHTGLCEAKSMVVMQYIFRLSSVCWSFRRYARDLHIFFRQAFFLGSLTQLTIVDFNGTPGPKVSHVLWKRLRNFTKRYADRKLRLPCGRAVYVKRDLVDTKVPSTRGDNEWKNWVQFKRINVDVDYYVHPILGVLKVVSSYTSNTLLTMRVADPAGPRYQVDKNELVSAVRLEHKSGSKIFARWNVSRPIRNAVGFGKIKCPELEWPPGHLCHGVNELRLVHLGDHVLIKMCRLMRCARGRLTEVQGLVFGIDMPVASIIGL